MRNSISEITAQLERDFYYLQCTENYQLASRKMILDNNTLIILNDFMSMSAYWEDGHHAFDRNMIEIV